MRKLCVGDLHGSYDKLMSALDAVKFSDTDILYCTGDICDRGPQIYETLDFVMSLENRFKTVFGNHDVWMYNFIKHDIRMDAYVCWERNGGKKTIKSLKGHEDKFDDILRFYESMPYIIDEKDFRIVHTLAHDYVWDSVTDNLNNITLGTSNKYNLLKDSTYDEELFDRSLLYKYMYNVDDYNINDKNFGKNKKFTIIGHTPLDGNALYIKELNTVDIDTGGFCNKKDYGCDGRISILDIENKMIYDSDKNKYSILTDK